MNVANIYPNAGFVVEQKLLPLKPRGFDNGHIEAMSSYLCRLAKIHGAQPHSFAANARRMFSEYTPKGKGGGGGGGGLVSCNSIGVIAEQTARALENGGAVENAASMTLVPWRPLIEKATIGVLTNQIRYCYECVMQDLAGFGEPYLRLTWQLRPIVACHIHNRRLDTVCPKCQVALPTTPWLPEPFFCLKCRQQIHEHHHKLKRATGEEGWIAHELSQLMRRTNCEEETFAPDALFDGLDYVLHQYCDGSRGQFQKRVGVTKDTCSQWFSRRNQPSFTSLIHILVALKISPSNLFLTKYQELDWLGSLRRSAVPKKVRRRFEFPKEALDQIAQSLKSQTSSKQPLKGIGKTAKDFGATHTIVKYHFPDEYAAYQRRYQKERVERVANQKAHRVEKVCEQARVFLEEGVYPSQRKLRRTRRVTATDLARPDVRLALEALLLEFGWRPGGARI